MADGLTKAQKEEVEEEKKTWRQRLFQKRFRAEVANQQQTLTDMVQSETGVVSSVVTSVIGGAVASPVRRKLVGRVTKGVRGQAFGLVLMGGAVKWAAGPKFKVGADGKQELVNAGIPYLGKVGDAHASVAGFILAESEGYGTKAEPDPVKVALEGTTHKALSGDDDEKKD